MREIIDNIDIEVIQEDIYNSNQSWHLEKIILVGDHSFRIKIRRNAYDSQSYANGYVLDDYNGWNRVIHLAMNKNLKCHNISYIDRYVTTDDFRTDELNIIKKLFALYRIKS